MDTKEINSMYSHLYRLAFPEVVKTNKDRYSAKKTAKIKAVDRDRRWRAAHWQEWLAYRRSYHRVNGHHKTRTIANAALKRGKLIRLPCEVCGNPTSHFHHDDYSKPLNVRHLCTTHHLEEHCRG